MRGSRTWLNALRAIEGQGMIDGREMQREMEKCMTTEGEAKQSQRTVRHSSITLTGAQRRQRTCPEQSRRGLIRPLEDSERSFIGRKPYIRYNPRLHLETAVERETAVQAIHVPRDYEKFVVTFWMMRSSSRFLRA